MTTQREETKADEDKPRFVGPFVRLTRALKDGKRDDLWVRFADVLSVTSPAEWQCAHKGAQTCVALLGTQDFVTEPPALVLGLLAEALEKAGREEHWRVEQQIAALAKSVASADRAGCLDGPEVDTPYMELTTACVDLFDALGIEPPRAHEDICAAVERGAERLRAQTMQVRKLGDALRNVCLAMESRISDADKLHKIVETLGTVRLDGAKATGAETVVEQPCQPGIPFLRAQVRRLLGHIGLCRHSWLNKLEDGSLPLEEIEQAVSDSCERHKTLVSELDQQLRALDGARDEVAVLRQRLATYEPEADS